MAESESEKLQKLKERRKFKRVGASLRLSYQLQGETEAVEVNSVDISAGGACLWLNKLIKKGSLLEVKARIGAEKQVICCMARVAWQSLRPVKGDDGKYYYQTGVQFEDLDLKDRIKLIYYCHNVDRDEKKK